MIGQYCTLYAEGEGSDVLFVVAYLDHNVSEVFEDRDAAIRYFEHVERYEAHQAKKGRR